jgi:hypothetical protein
VSQQLYYIQVNGVAVPGDDCNVNNYVLEIENFAAPTPTNVVLDLNDDSGWSNMDLTTYV